MFRARDDRGILAQVAEHARHDHGLTQLPDQLIDAVRQHITTIAA